MNLSPHFTDAELTSSTTAARLGISNKPGIQESINLRKLCNEILEPIRIKYGRPIIITSGFRCSELNKAVKGSKTSQHLTGSAADISCSGSKAALFRMIESMIKNKDITVGQLIWEYGTMSEPSWVHVSLPYTKKNEIIYIGVK